MKVIVDTSAWSLFLRRPIPPADLVDSIQKLIAGGRVQMLGMIRQELLSGVKLPQAFEALKQQLDAFADWPVATDDHVEAAKLYNACRARGVQGSAVDFLICAISIRHKMKIYAVDQDFTRYAQIIPIDLFDPAELSSPQK